MWILTHEQLAAMTSAQLNYLIANHWVERNERGHFEFNCGWDKLQLALNNMP